MYWTITVILLVLWAVGLITGSTEGHWVHLFLLFSLASLVLALMSRGRRPLAGAEMGASGRTRP